MSSRRAYGRVAPFAARGTAALIGLLGFTAIYLVPFLKYPATPPAVGNPDTIQLRTGIYLALLVISIAAMVLAVLLQRRLLPTSGGWNATLVAGAAYVVAMAVCYLVLPSINEIPQPALPGVVNAVGDADSPSRPRSCGRSGWRRSDCRWSSGPRSRSCSARWRSAD